jgi:hypothetical protein
MESPQREKGVGMTIVLVRKPPIGKMNSERLKIVLAGTHTMKQKTCMLMQVKFWLHQEHGIDNAGPSDAYLSLVDPNGYPLTTFRNGLSVGDYNLVIDSPYHCAADSYQP